MAKKWYVVIEREFGKDFAVGPYPNESTAEEAMDHSLLVDSLVEDDAIECYLEILEFDDARTEFLVIGIDITNRDHFAPRKA